MKNLISKTRDGHINPSVKNEAIGLKHRKTLKYDVWTEVWEFDRRIDWFEILQGRCNEDQEVVYSDEFNIETYGITSTHKYIDNIKKMINNDEVFELLLNTDFFMNLPTEAKAGLT